MSSRQSQSSEKANCRLYICGNIRRHYCSLQLNVLVKIGTVAKRSLKCQTNKDALYFHQVYYIFCVPSIIMWWYQGVLVIIWFLAPWLAMVCIIAVQIYFKPLSRKVKVTHFRSSFGFLVIFFSKTQNQFDSWSDNDPWSGWSARGPLKHTLQNLKGICSCTSHLYPNANIDLKNDVCTHRQ